MKTDRELLELAAKAIGAEWDCKLNVYWLADSEGVSFEWNPLKDDGDALRLAVSLRIEYCYGYGLGGEVQRVIVYDDLHVMVQDCDVCAAARRAITRAAAEIGKDMP